MFGLVSPSIINTDLEPVYPMRAKREGLNGSVSLNLMIDPLGAVIGVEIEEFSDNVFLTSAIEYANKLKFLPATFGGMDVMYSSTIVVNFKLS